MFGYKIIGANIFTSLIGCYKSCISKFFIFYAFTGIRQYMENKLFSTRISMCHNWNIIQKMNKTNGIPSLSVYKHSFVQIMLNNIFV